MVEPERKKSSLKLSQTFIDPGEISESLKTHIKNHFPLYLGDDATEILEECSYLIQDLKKIINDHKDDLQIIEYILCRLNIMVYKCPYSKVSDLYEPLYKELLTTYESISWQEDIRVTFFYSNENLPSIRDIILSIEKDEHKLPNVMLIKEMNKETLYKLLRDIYNSRCGRLTNLDRILLWYPDYLKYFHTMTQILMLGEGPLSVDYRYFIAIIAVASYGCEYLYYSLVDNFLNAGGDQKWLEDKESLPEKLHKIIEICLEFAYKPWHLKYNPSILQGIMKGTDSWSRQELTQLFTILAFYNSLCGVVYGMGILPEADFPRDIQKDLLLRQSNHYIDMMTKKYSKVKMNEEILNTLKSMTVEEQKAEDENIKEKISNGNDTYKKKPKIEELIKEDINEPEDAKSNLLFERFFDQKKIEFKTFEHHGGTGIFSTDYTWTYHGYYELGTYFPDLANMINEKYLYITKLTLQSFGEEQAIDTKPYRTAIYNYTTFIYGYVRPDYNYKDVNLLLPKDFKAFLKSIACMPQAITYPVINKLPVDFEPYEICHIALLISEAKFQMELMWGLLALQKA